MRIRNILIILFVAGTGFLLKAQDNIIDEVVWVVGDEPILRSEVEAARLMELEQGVKFSGDPYCIIPEQIAIQKLFLHQADLDSLTVSDNDVMSMVDRQINLMVQRAGSREKLEEYSKKPISKLREGYREQVRNQQLVDLVKRNLIGNISVTPTEIREFYNKMNPDSIPTIPSESEVEIITVNPQYDPAEIAEIKQKLLDITDRVNKGANFSTMAKMYSEDRVTAKAGGEMDFMGKGDLLPEFANVAFAMSDPKKVSKVVETEYGFHIIQLIEKRGDRISCRHILLKPHITATERNKSLARLDSIADLVRTQKLTFAAAAQMYSFDKDTRNNGGLMVNPETGSTKFQVENLPAEINRQIKTMKIGEISSAFSMIVESKDKEVCAIVRLKSRSKSHKANLTDDFQLFKQMVQNSKSEKVIADWISQKQKKTYVRIDEKWNKCEFQYPGWITK